MYFSISNDMYITKKKLILHILTKQKQKIITKIGLPLNTPMISFSGELLFII